MTEDLTAHLAGLARALAAPLPSPEELGAGKAEDRAMAERICKARPGIPLHHAYAVLETLRTIQRVEAAKAEPEAHHCDDECVCPLDGKPLLYWPAGDQHACQDPDCANAHGVPPELTREDAVEAMQDMSTDLYRAEDRLAFVREMCDAADRNGQQLTTAQVRAWTQYNGCANSTPDGAELARSLGFAIAAMLPDAEPVFCHHENAQGSVHETHQAGWGRKTVQTVFCPTCKARAESTEGEPVLAPTLLNTERCTPACTKQHTNGPGCLIAPDWSKPIFRSKP